MNDVCSAPSSTSRDEPLVRLTVIRRPDGTDRLLLTCHFLLWDGWSRELVLRELFALYDSRGARGVLPLDGPAFTDYLAWIAAQDSARNSSGASATVIRMLANVSALCCTLAT